MSDPFLVPIGFFGGAFFTDPNDAPEWWQVRIGRDVFHLPTFADMNVWFQARGAGAGDQIDHSRPAVVTAAEAGGFADASAIVDSLILSGLIVEVGSEEWPVERFAATYALHPLMVGIGNAPEHPEVFRLGLDNAHVYAGLDAQQYDVWALTHLSKNIEAAAHEVVRSREPEASREDIERICRVGADLVAMNAAYVDRAVLTDAAQR